MSKHYTINIRVTETEKVDGSTRTHPTQDRKVEEVASVTVRAEDKDSLLTKVLAIIPAL